MKLAALQLMQQKASKVESSHVPGERRRLVPRSPSLKIPSARGGGEAEGSNASGLAKVKELAETIASDDGTGGAAGEPQAKGGSGCYPTRGGGGSS